MINDKITQYYIDGIFGRLDFYQLEVDNKFTKSSYGEQVINIKTEDVISTTDDTNGLPLEMDEDTYFKMALINSLDKIDKSIGRINGTINQTNILVSNIFNYYKDKDKIERKK